MSVGPENCRLRPHATGRPPAGGALASHAHRPPPGRPGPEQALGSQSPWPAGEAHTYPAQLHCPEGAEGLGPAVFPPRGACASPPWPCSPRAPGAPRAPPSPGRAGGLALGGARLWSQRDPGVRSNPHLPQVHGNQAPPPSALGAATACPPDHWRPGGEARAAHPRPAPSARVRPPGAPTGEGRGRAGLWPPQLDRNHAVTAGRGAQRPGSSPAAPEETGPDEG